ncbi:MAG: hypothetical protein LGB78_06540 [Sulfurovum sp.]|nr:hypothetical protein [Sulfurovum sp.]
MSRKFNEWNRVKQNLHNNKQSNTLLVQARVYDVKRLEDKIGKMESRRFYKVKSGVCYG